MSLARRTLLRRGRDLLRGTRGGLSALDGLNDSQQAELTAIHRALDRIERGIFGRCEGCFGNIAAPVLEEAPWKGLCATCESAPEASMPGSFASA